MSDTAVDSLSIDRLFRPRVRTVCESKNPDGSCGSFRSDVLIAAEVLSLQHRFRSGSLREGPRRSIPIINMAQPLSASQAVVTAKKIPLEQAMAPAHLQDVTSSVPSRQLQRLSEREKLLMHRIENAVVQSQKWGTRRLPDGSLASEMPAPKEVGAPEHRGKVDYEYLQCAVNGKMPGYTGFMPTKYAQSQYQ